jgi:hypothetical protein
MDKTPWLFEDSQRSVAGAQIAKGSEGKPRIEEPLRAQGEMRFEIPRMHWSCRIPLA